MVELNGTLFVQILNFFILVAILAKFAYKPLVQVMEERRERIAKDLEGAEAAKNSARELEAAYKEQLMNARAEAQTIITKATKEAELVAQKQLIEVRTQIAREKEKAQEEIAREREKAMQQIHEEVVSLSISLAGKVVGQNLDNDANARLVQEAIQKLDNKSIGL